MQRYKSKVGHRYQSPVSQYHAAIAHAHAEIAEYRVIRVSGRALGRYAQEALSDAAEGVLYWLDVARRARTPQQPISRVQRLINWLVQE